MTLRLDKPPADSVPDKASGFMDVEFFHDPRPVRFRGFNAYIQQGGDLFGGFAFSHKLKNLQFTGAQ